jgi:mono/diheme cytochrome c family protein
MLPPSPTQVYRAACRSCHDGDGRGEAVRETFPKIPDFTNHRWQASRDDDELSRAILHGKGKAMRPMKAKLGALEVGQMVAFVRAFRGGGLIVEDGAEGASAGTDTPADSGKPSSPEPLAGERPSGGKAEAVYRKSCRECHGEDGRGTALRKTTPAIPDFNDARWQSSRHDDELRRSILEGKGAIMPPMADELGSARAEVGELVAFVRGFPARAKTLASAPAPAPEPSSARPPQASTPSRRAARAGGPVPAAPQPSPAARPVHGDRLRAAMGVFRTSCTACHGEDGRGGVARAALPTVPDFSAREWQARRDDPELAVSILDGKGALMPAWRGRLREDQVQDLVALVRTFGPPGLLTSGAPATDFTKRFRALREQWEALDEQIQTLSRPQDRGGPSASRTTDPGPSRR